MLVDSYIGGIIALASMVFLILLDVMDGNEARIPVRPFASSGGRDGQLRDLGWRGCDDAMTTLRLQGSKRRVRIKQVLPPD